MDLRSSARSWPVVLLLALLVPLSGCVGWGASIDPAGGGSSSEDGDEQPTAPPPAVSSNARAPLLELDGECEHRRCELHARATHAAPRFVAFSWSFGDGNLSHGQHARHLFAEPGAHRVLLSGRTEGGVVHTVERTLHITDPAPDERPIARIRWSCQELHCDFDARSSQDLEGALVEHRWDFGDGWRLTHPVVGHEYARSGTFRVTLTVVDAAGLTDTTTAVVEAARPPPPPPPPTTQPETEPGSDNATSSETEPREQPTPPANPPPAPTPPPAGAPASASSESTGSLPPCSTRTNETGEQRTFTWSYRGRNWTWGATIPDSWWRDYASRERPQRWQDFAVMAADPQDDTLLSDLACFIDTVATGGGFSEYERIEFALRFVQSLRYNTDLAGAGFDEYPKFPIETMLDQEGDCEDTSVLFASLARALGYDVVLLVFESTNRNATVGHAAVGLASANLTGSYWTHDGTRYYYVETTGSYGGIGHLPETVRGQSAHIFPVAPRPILGQLWWSTPHWEDGGYLYEIEVANVGTAPLENLTLWAGWDAGGGRAWGGTTRHTEASVQPGSTRVVTLHLDVPPPDVSTRMWIKAWGDSVEAVEAFSAWFET